MNKEELKNKAIEVVRQSMNDYTQCTVGEYLKLSEYQLLLAQEYVKLIDESKEFN